SSELGISENRKQRGGCGCFSQGYGSLCHFHNTGTFGHGHCQRKEPEPTCPKCRNHRLLVWNKVVKCPDKACGWLQFRIVCGVPLSLVDIENLVTKGKTNLIKDMKSNSGNKFNARIVMNDKTETSFEFDNRQPKRK